ncbi:glutathione S-transferase family protein, partial [Tritonibacter horizontis]|uniref:glutathione S-transferase family protein n=1 Tax=Tritonibacter horizontis TaxID=1768241 RepID=UPI000834C1E0
MNLHLMSHALCPYVQRAAISLFEKDVAVERTTIDLARKPDWFLALSPLGKTPVLTVEGQPIFDSVAILEFLEESQTPPLHPADPVVRAQHRGWIAFASEMLNDIAGFYGTSDPTVFDQKIAAMTRKVRRLEDQLSAGPYFNGATFSLVDAAFALV